MKQRSFVTPEDAIAALRVAAEARDKAALRDIFGSQIDELLTGDQTQDATNARKFAAALKESCTPMADGENKITFEIGTNNWPMPIPLVKAGGQWQFDTAAGKDEIIARHIGKDELHAVGLCRAYVMAQQDYAKVTGGFYARNFKSGPGKNDGLSWPTAGSEKGGLSGSSLANAPADGNAVDPTWHPQPFHGYYFRILTCQGKSAPSGRKNYLERGKLAGGFALVAYPAHWDKSGVMTFIVSRDGQVYERNLGEETSRIAKKMKEYNPDDHWNLVQDEGLLTGILEKH